MLILDLFYTPVFLGGNPTQLTPDVSGWRGVDLEWEILPSSALRSDNYLVAWLLVKRVKKTNQVKCKRIISLDKTSIGNQSEAIPYLS